MSQRCCIVYMRKKKFMHGSYLLLRSGLYLLLLHFIGAKVCMCVPFVSLDEKVSFFNVFSGLFHHSAEELWIVACFHSACSFSIPSPALHWQRQTLLLICWTPPLPSYPTGKLKQDRKAYIFPFLSVSLLCPLCTAAPDSPAVIQNFWHMHTVFMPLSSLSVCLCVLAALMCGAWVFYNMFNITPQGLTT